MAIKIQRPGQSETSIMFFTYLYDNNLISYEEYIQNMRRFITWLFFSSGMYNKQFDISYITDGLYEDGMPKSNLSTYKIKEILHTNFFQNWIRTYQKSLINSHHIEFMHKSWVLDRYGQHISGFISSFNIAKESNCSIDFDLFDNKPLNHLNKFISDKRVLLVSCFADIIKQHHDNGRLHKFNPDIAQMKEIITYNCPYSFFNDGPHENYNETLQHAFDHIESLSFDIALISYGAYASVLADHIYHTHNTTAIAYGGRLPSKFGVLSMGSNPHRISQIPDRYICDKAFAIEGGRYWYENNGWNKK